MKYVLLYLNDEMAMAALPPAELDRIVEAKTRVGQDLFAQGKAVAGLRLWPTATAARITRSGDRLSIVEGPFVETKEVVGGLDIIECGSRDEALEWTRRFPAPFVNMPCEIEVREMFELDDFAPSESVERFRDFGLGNR